MPLPTDQALPERGHRYVMPLCSVIVVVAMVLDVLVRHSNFSILYIIPLLLCAKLNRRLLLVKFAMLLVCLTYLGLVVRDIHSGQPLNLQYIPNRHLVSLTLLVMTAVLYFWQGVTLQFRRGANVSYLQSSAPTLFEEMEESISRLVVVVLCIILIGMLLVLDMITPVEINFPILFAIPLVLATWSRSLKLLWALVPVLSASAWVSFFYGAPMSDYARQRHVTERSLAFNRALANFVVIVVAIIMHVAISRRKKAMTSGRTPIKGPDLTAES